MGVIIPVEGVMGGIFCSVVGGGCLCDMDSGLILFKSSPQRGC